MAEKIKKSIANNRLYLTKIGVTSLGCFRSFYSLV